MTRSCPLRYACFWEPYMDYFPLALKISGWGCLVVGGGPVAFRRAERFHRAGGKVRVVSPSIVGDFESLKDIEYRAKPFDESDLEGIFIAQAATNDPDVNRTVAKLCKERGILVNVGDDFPVSDYLVPMLVERGDLQVAITTNGASPAFGKWLKQRLEGWLPPEMESFIAFLGHARRQGKDRIRDDHARAELARVLASPESYQKFTQLDAAERHRWLAQLMHDYAARDQDTPS